MPETACQRAVEHTVDEMAEQILRNRERYGLTYYTVHGPYMEALAPVIERVRSNQEEG